MTWYKVPVHAYLQAPDEISAVETVLDRLRGMMAHGGPASELDDKQMEPLFQLEELLDQAKADSDAGATIEIDGFPGAKFTPHAAAQLAALKFEVFPTQTGNRKQTPTIASPSPGWPVPSPRTFTRTWTRGLSPSTRSSTTLPRFTPGTRMR